ncbi:MAG: HDOD domain-containing protein [Fimbriimonadales bacterium]|nr:HDOD domain-containing protein [Fimbriimonadales bacterium]
MVEFGSLALKVARSENLPVLPQVASSVLRLADDPNASPKMMERVIEKDPAVTAKILRVANSAYYGLSNVGDIGRAIGVLGMNAVRSLVVGVVFQQMASSREHAPSYSKLEYWRHSLAVAVTSRILAKLKMPDLAEELYVAGMMHDVGMLVMDRFCPDEFDRAILFARAQQVPLNLAEKLVLGFDHCQVGAMLASKWGLTPMVARAIEFHHRPASDSESASTNAIVSLADGLAHRAGFTNNVPLTKLPDWSEALSIVGIPEAQLEVVQQVVVQEVIRAQEAFKIV